MVWLLRDVDSTTVRLLFRVVFTVLFFYLGVIGNQSNKQATKLRLLKRKKIPVCEATPWLQSAAVMQPLYNMRRLPNVTWWSLMAFIAALSKLTDLASNTVSMQYLPWYCDFGTGMVLSGTDTFYIPPFNGRSSFVASNAQLNSVANGCNQGIYLKVNTDPRFCAADDDFIGHWDCTAVGEDVTYAYGQWTYEDASEDLVTRNLMYSNWSSYVTHSDDYDWTHLVVWSSSQPDNSKQVFDVKASIGTIGGETDDKAMHSMYCQMYGAGAEDIANAIPSNSALDTWAPLFQGYMYYGSQAPAVYNPEGTLAWYLNTLIMVAGGSDYLNATAPEDYQTQGCLVETSIIPNWLLALLGVTVLLCLVMTLLYPILLIRVRKHADRARVAHAPVDVWTWMAQAVAESDVKSDGTVDFVRPKDLHQWSIELTDGTTVRIEKRALEMGERARLYE